MTHEAPLATDALAPLGLSAAPFGDTCDDAFFFPSHQHLRAMEVMGHALWSKARLAVVTAEHGCGKTLLMRRLLRDLDERIVVAAVDRDRIAPQDFLLEILRQFGFALEGDDRTNRRRLLERFLLHQASMGRLCLLVVENAQSMHPSVLEELRHLAAIEEEGAKVLKMLLLGRPTLNHVVDSPRMADLLAPGVERFALAPLSEDQTAAYVAHRLRAAGASDPDALMPHTLMAQVHEATGGVPGRINRLCARALELAAAQGTARLGPQVLEQAASELGWPIAPNPAPASAPRAGAHRAQAAATLVVAMQGLPDRHITMETSRVLIGRGEEAEVTIDSVFVSRYHALIIRDGGYDLLIDLGSTNGLLVNSRRVARRVLKHRDLIQIGPARITYLNPQAAPAEAPDPGETVVFGHAPAGTGTEGRGTLLSFGRGEPPRR